MNDDAGMAGVISIIVPVYNEEANVAALYERLKSVLQSIAHRYSHEIIFVNDGSRDATGSRIEALTLKDTTVRFIEFSRNFGKEVAMSAGLRHANGAAAIMIDADLQHPPELIPEFINAWEAGAEVVVGVRKYGAAHGMMKRTGSYFFYKIMNRIGDVKITPNATDFRLLDRAVIAAFNQFTEKSRITRGLIDWLGFRQTFVYFTAQDRSGGAPSYTFIKLLRLAISSMVSMSLFPLRLAGYLGAAITVVAGMCGVFIIVEKYVLDDIFKLHISIAAGLAVLNLFLVGVMLSCLGLIALYIANIHNEVVGRPMYVIRKTGGVSSTDDASQPVRVVE